MSLLPQDVTLIARTGSNGTELCMATVNFGFGSRARVIVRDIRNQYPETEGVFEQFRVRPSCWYCSVSVAAQRSEISVDELLGALNATIASRLRAKEE